LVFTVERLIKFIRNDTEMIKNRTTVYSLVNRGCALVEYYPTGAAYAVIRKNESMPVQGESSMPSPDGEQSVDGRVRAWLRKQRDDLINMSRRNRLLHFKHTKTASLAACCPP
jgi:hypothetical protein